MRPTASSLLLKCRWSTAPRRHNQPEIVASGVINKKHTMSPKRVRFSCWGPGFLSHCRKNTDKASVSTGRMFYLRWAACLQNADQSLWGGHMDHMQDVALAVPRELPSQLLPLAASWCASLATRTSHIVYSAVVKAAFRRGCALRSAGPGIWLLNSLRSSLLNMERITCDSSRVQKMFANILYAILRWFFFHILLVVLTKPFSTCFQTSTCKQSWMHTRLLLLRGY